jgi:hypothetical protein
MSHLYVENETEQLDLIEPTEQPIEAFELCLVVQEGVQDASVEKVVKTTQNCLSRLGKKALIGVVLSLKLL